MALPYMLLQVRVLPTRQWPDTDSDAEWVSLPWARVQTVTEATGAEIGQAVAAFDYGPQILPGAAEETTIGYPEDLLFPGEWVRILRQSSAGTIAGDSLGAFAGGETFTALWYGVLADVPTQSDMRDDMAAGQAQIIMADLRQVLNTVVADFSYVLSTNPAAPGWPNAVVSTAQAFAFNAIERGDRTEQQYDIDVGSGTATETVATAHVHEMSGGGMRWNARQAIEYLLALASGAGSLVDLPRDPVAGRLPWALVGQVEALEYDMGRMERQGSLLAQISQMISQGRGLTWRVEVQEVNDRPTACIVVSTSVSADVVVDAEVVLPASDRTVSALDLRERDSIEEPTIEVAESNQADIVILTGNQPITTMSMAFDTDGNESGAVIGGWTPAQETARDAALFTDERPLDLLHVYTRYDVRASWDWRQQQVTGAYDEGLATVFDTSIFFPHGANGLQGDRLWSAEQHIPGQYGIGILPYLALARGQEGTLDPEAYDGRPGGPPLLFGVLPDDTLVDVSSDLAWGVNQEPPGFQFDDADSSVIKLTHWIDDYDHLIWTVSLREVWPLRVSWRRDPEQWPRSSPRVREIRGEWNLVQALEGTVTGYSVAFSPEVLDSTVVLEDDRPAMVRALALLLQMWERRSAVIEYTAFGTDLSSDPALSSVVAEYVVDQQDLAIDGVVTTIVWQAQPAGIWSRRYRIESIVPDAERFL